VGLKLFRADCKDGGNARGGRSTLRSRINRERARNVWKKTNILGAARIRENGSTFVWVKGYDQVTRLRTSSKRGDGQDSGHSQILKIKEGEKNLQLGGQRGSLGWGGIENHPSDSSRTRKGTSHARSKSIFTRSKGWSNRSLKGKHRDLFLYPTMIKTISEIQEKAGNRDQRTRAGNVKLHVRISMHRKTGSTGPSAKDHFSVCG